MSNFSDFKREDQTVEVKTGKRRCVVLGAEEGVSKSSGLPMIIITVQPQNSNAKVKTYIVKNDKFNKKMTEFFDAFPTINFGSFDFISWVGAIGAADFGTDDNGYLRVKWFINPKQAENLPEWTGDKPEQQTVTKIGDGAEEEDDLPF